MGHPRPLFRLFSVFSNKQYNFYNKSMWKNVHPVYSTGIWTHNLLNMSRHPLPLDQGSRPTLKFVYNIGFNFRCNATGASYKRSIF